MSKYLQKLEESAGFFEEAESRTISKHSSKNSSLIASKENQYSIKYEDPQYQSVKNTYEVLKPITKQVMELPPMQKKKIKTAKTIIQKEIVVNNEEELNKILQGEDLINEEIPLPTKSTIQNLLKDSIVINDNKNSLYNSQRLKSTKNNLINNIHNINNNSHQNHQQQNIEENMIKSQIVYNTNKLSTNYNINNTQGKYKNKTILQSHNPKIKSEMNINNINKVFNNNNKIKISYKNKNYIETFFHDDNIPKPNVCEGDALEFTDIKKQEKEINEEENNNIKNMLDELPIEHTVILSNQPKIDMSKIQKENMLQKSLTSDKSQISNTQSINNNYNNYNKYKSQNINYNNNINSKINNTNINNNITNSMKMKKYKQNIINSVKPLPEIDMNNNMINNNNLINSTHMKIKPKMELQMNKTNINNNNNINNSNINNKSKMSFPTSSYGGSFISQTSMPENPFQDNTSYNKENNNK